LKKILYYDAWSEKHQTSKICFLYMARKDLMSSIYHLNLRQCIGTRWPG